MAEDRSHSNGLSAGTTVQGAIAEEEGRAWASQDSMGGTGLEDKGQQAGRREWRERTEKAEAGLGA